MTPGEQWRDAFDAMTLDQRLVIARSLRARTDIDPAQTDYALRPFAPLHDGKRWWLAAITYPCPVNVPECLAWEPDGDVILIDPMQGATAGAMHLLGDDGGMLVAPEFEPAADGSVKVYTNGLTFARDWVAARARWIDAVARDLAPGSRSEPSGQPGIALCGQLSSVVDFAPLRSASRVVVDNPRMTKPLADALLRSAALPSVDAMPARLRAVA